MKLISLLLLPLIFSPMQEKMPDISKLVMERETHIYCKSENKPDVTLRWYEQKEIGMALTASRYGKKKPFAVMFRDGYVYLDNRTNGIAEDGYIDSYINLNEVPDKGICEDMPKDLEV